MGGKLCIDKSNVSSSPEVRISSPANEEGKDENFNGESFKDILVSSAPKVPLAPGKGLMDWIRLTNASEDLAGTGGKTLKVTDEDLKAHSELENAWMVINGKVYNVGPYMEYHPGGIDQLMLGAGVDGTDLFNETHPWVNYESMLKACFVGVYVGSRDNIRRKSSAGSSRILPSVASVLSNTSLKTAKKSTLSENGVSIEWKDRDGLVGATVSSKWQLDVDKLNVELAQEGSVSKLRILLRPPNTHPLEAKWDVQSAVDLKSLKVEKVGSTQNLAVTFNKDSSVDSGSGVSDCEKLKPSSVILRPNMKYRKFKLVSREQVTHNTHLFELEPPEGCILSVPIGHHVYIRVTIDGMLLSRPYTPVNQDLEVQEHKQTMLTPHNLFLMIKIYSDGVVTPVIDKLNLEETIEVSDPEGTFYVDNLAKWTDLALIAAGTGFTPMVRICRYWLDALNRKSPKLLFFNKASKDILWRAELERMSRSHSEKVHLRTILSDPEPGWKGPAGKVSEEILKQSLISPKGFNTASKNQFICICGPPKFTQLTFSLLKKLGFMESQIHLFQS